MLIDYLAKHKFWTDIITLNDVNKTFFRNNFIDEGGTYELSNSSLILKWNRWNPETLETVDNGITFVCSSISFVLTKITTNNKFVFIICGNNINIDFILEQSYTDWIAIICTIDIERIPKNDKFIIMKYNKSLNISTNRHISIMSAFSNPKLKLTEDHIIFPMNFTNPATFSIHENFTNPATLKKELPTSEVATLERHTLKLINSVYETEDLLTYAYYKKSDSTCTNSTIEIIGKIRDSEIHDNYTFSLKTFKYKLYKELVDRDKDGNFFNTNNDLNFTISLIEIAGFNRIKFNDIPKGINSNQEFKNIDCSFKKGIFGTKLVLSDLKHFWINISSYKDRKNSMEKQFKEIGIGNLRLDAHTPTTLPKIIPSIKFPSRDLLYACTSSHIKAIKTGYDLKFDWFVVMEDDILYKTDLNYNKILEDIPKDAEILQLHTNNINLIRSLHEYYSSTKELWKKREDHTYSTGIYVISREGAKKILEFFPGYPEELDFTNVKTHISADFLIYELAKTYILTYPFFTENINLETLSIIHGHRDGYKFFEDLIKCKEKIWYKKDFLNN